MQKSKIVRDVEAFHKKMHLPVRKIPHVPGKDERDLRMRLLSEEYVELQSGIMEKNLIDIADGAADLIYVTIGTLLHFGLPFDPIWNEVQRTNMLKEPGNTRGDGKILKPAGWVGPDIESIIRKLR